MHIRWALFRIKTVEAVADIDRLIMIKSISRAELMSSFQHNNFFFATYAVANNIMAWRCNNLSHNLVGITAKTVINDQTAVMANYLIRVFSIFYISIRSTISAVSAVPAVVSVAAMSAESTVVIKSAVLVMSGLLSKSALITKFALLT